MPNWGTPYGMSWEARGSDKDRYVARGIPFRRMHVHYSLFTDYREAQMGGWRRGTLSFPCRPSRIDLSISLILFLSLFLAIYVCSLCSWRAHTHPLTAPFQYMILLHPLCTLSVHYYTYHTAKFLRSEKFGQRSLAWCGWPPPSPCNYVLLHTRLSPLAGKKWPVPTRPISVT